MADHEDPLGWLLGPAAPVPVSPTPTPAPAAQGDDGFAAWMMQAAGAPESDEWSALGLTGFALECVREWAGDLAAASLPGATRLQQRLAPTLAQLLREIRDDPQAFQARAGNPEKPVEHAPRPQWWEA